MRKGSRKGSLCQSHRDILKQLVASVTPNNKNLMLMPKRKMPTAIGAMIRFHSRQRLQDMPDKAEVRRWTQQRRTAATATPNNQTFPP
jgi:hypothetical protein